MINSKSENVSHPNGAASCNSERLRIIVSLSITASGKQKAKILMEITLNLTASLGTLVKRGGTFL